MARTQDYRLGEFAFPRGWFVVADGTNVGATPLSERFFGEDVILYRGASGKVVMLDAYCPHMGTHLGKNTTAGLVRRGQRLDGDSIRCPFHGWRFGPDGRCNEIPYHDGRIPEQAKIRSWHVEERYGIVFCWHDPEALAPDFPLPEYPEWDDAQWVRWQLDDLKTLSVHPQEIVDNLADVRHLTCLHNSGKVVWYENEAEGPYLHQRHLAITERAEYGMSRMTAIVRVVGPALVTSRYYTGDSNETGLVHLIANTPVEDGVTRIWQASMMKSPKPIIDDEVRAMARGANDMLKFGFMEDFEAWANKRPALTIMQLPSDGPFAKNRTWYSQFYNPRAKTEHFLQRSTGPYGAKGVPTYAEYSATR